MKRFLLCCALVAGWVPSSWSDDPWVIEPTEALRAGEAKALEAAGITLASSNQYRWWVDGAESVQSLTLTEPDGTTHDLMAETLNPVTNCYVLMADTSLSMKPSWPGVVESMNSWADKLPPQSVSLAGFAEDLLEIVPFGMAQTPDDLKQAIAGISLKGKNTQLFLAVNQAIKRLEGCEATRRHLVVFSDGDAEDKATTLADVKKLANEQQVAVHTVGFGDLSRGGTSLKLQVLKTLSTDTQGSYHHFEGDVPALQTAIDQTLERYKLAGMVNLDPMLLGYGVEQLQLTLVVSTLAGSDQTLEEPLSVTGADQWDNVLVLISRRTGGTDPWLVIGGAGLLLLLLLVAWILLSASKRKKRQAEEDAKQQAMEEKLGQQLKQQQAQQEAENRRLQAEVGQALQSVSDKIDEFQPDAMVSAKGTAWGWLRCSDGRQFELLTYSTTIGRNEGENDIAITNDKTISGQHAILDYKNGKFIWTDRAPLNPTLLNGEEMSGSQEIMPQQLIQIGMTQLELVLNASGQPS